MSLFMENDAGVHLMSRVNPEYTFCGDSFDNEFAESPLNPTSKKVVTCPGCAREILEARGVRVKQEKER